MRTRLIIAATAVLATFAAPALAGKPASTPGNGNGNGNGNSQNANHGSGNSNAPKGPPASFPGGGATGGVFPGGHNHPPVSGQ